MAYGWENVDTLRKGDCGGENGSVDGFELDHGDTVIDQLVRHFRLARHLL